MAMKNAKNVHFLQIDHQVKNIFSLEGVVVMPSPIAYKKYPWTKRLFLNEPKEGYFIWVKKQVDFPLRTCISLASFKTSQNLSNLMIIEKNLKIKAEVLCNALKNNLYGIHQAKGKLILKEGASLEYNHFHFWGENDLVNPDYEFYLEKGAKLFYHYKNFQPPKNLNFKTSLELEKDSQVDLKVDILANKSLVNLEENLILKGENSKGIIRLRLVSKNKSEIKSLAKITALNKATGHLDCQGRLVDNYSKISLIPNLVCLNKNAQLTHEASIGKISEEELIYLRSRGLTEKEAIDLIINGFLEK